MKKISRRQQVLAAAVVLVLALAGWVIWTVVHVAGLLSKAADDGQQIKQLIAAGKFDQIQGPLDRFRADADRASSAVHGISWSMLSAVPWLGSDAKGVRTAADVAKTLGDGPMADLTAVSRDLHQLTPHNGTVDIAAVRALAPTLEAAQKSLDEARTAINANDPSGYLSPLRDKYVKLQQEINSAAGGLDSASTALKVMPRMLGDEGPQHYLLMMENNAEIRASGGLPGVVAVLTADHGTLSLSDPVQTHDLKGATAPLLPINRLEETFFGQGIENIGDATLDPDFDRVAKLVSAAWQVSHPGPIDGVISMDTVALTYLLRATGPLTIGPETVTTSRGPVTVAAKTLTAADAADYLMHQIYIDYNDPTPQAAFFRLAAKTAFARISDGGAAPITLLQAFGQAAIEHRLLLQSFDPSSAGLLAGTTISGGVTSSPSGQPRMDVAFNDFTGAKMSYYLRYRVNLTTTSCAGGVRTVKADMTLTSVAPANAGATLPTYVTGGGLYGNKPGTMTVQYMLVGPRGGTLTDVHAHGYRLDDFLQTATVDGRPVASNYVGLDPGQSVQVTWTATSAAGQTVPIAFGMTPSIVAGSPDVTVSGHC